MKAARRVKPLRLLNSSNLGGVLPDVDLASVEDKEALHQMISTLMTEKENLTKQLKEMEMRKKKRLEEEGKLYPPFPHPRPPPEDEGTGGEQEAPDVVGHLWSKFKALEVMLKKQNAEIKALEEIRESEEGPPQEKQEEGNRRHAGGGVQVAVIADNKKKRSQGEPLPLTSWVPPPMETNNTPSTSTDNGNPPKAKHAVDHSKLGKGWYCVCKWSFPNQGRLTEHIKYFTADRKFQCDHCPHRFKALADLKAHMMSAHKLTFPQGTIGCGDCGTVFTDKEAHKAHRLSSHIKDESCRVHGKDERSIAQGVFRCLCGNDFPNEDNLSSHLSTYFSKYEFQCSKCPRTFKSMGQRSAHMEGVHNKKRLAPGAVGCGVCGQTFTVKKAFLQHMHKSHGVRTWPNHRFGDPWDKSQPHGFNPASPEGQLPRPKTCVLNFCICGSAYLTKALLKQHLQQMKAKVPFECSQCLKDFRDHDLLAEHMKQVHKVEDYVGFGCNVCGTVWPCQRTLKRHYTKEHQ